MRDLGNPAAPPQAFKLPVFYYGPVVVGIVAALLVVYNLVINKWCASATLPVMEQGTRRKFVEGTSINKYLLHSFRYKNGGVKVAGEYECVVCLSAFEDDEKVSMLHGCNHSFHAACIDMWLYSHPGCPLCRAPVVEQPLTEESSGEHSPDGLIGSTTISV